MEALTLNNGIEMPALGLGVFQTPSDETRDAVQVAVAREPDLLEGLFLAWQHAKAVHGDEHRVGPLPAAADSVPLPGPT